MLRWERQAAELSISSAFLVPPSTPLRCWFASSRQQWPIFEENGRLASAGVQFPAGPETWFEPNVSETKGHQASFVAESRQTFVAPA